MRILVAGGAGFLGSHLCELLLSQDHQVVALDNLCTGKRENVAHLLTGDVDDDLSMPFAFIEGDICDDALLTIDLGDWDRIYNLASPASPSHYHSMPIATLRTGSRGTEHLLALAEANGSRFLLASTSEIYGDPEIHPQHEDYWGNVNTVGPRSVYDEAKRYGEAITAAYHRENRADVRIARIFNTYGPRMRADDGRAVPNFICQALRGEPLTVYGTGNQTRSLCYVTDLVHGLERLMESDLTEPCNLGNPHELTVLDIAERVNHFTGNAAGVTMKPLPQDDPTRRCPNITRAVSRLNWQPKVSLNSGLKRTVEWFRSESTLAR